jgi:hypothetical protein
LLIGGALVPTVRRKMKRRRRKKKKKRTSGSTFAKIERPSPALTWQVGNKANEHV